MRRVDLVLRFVVCVLLVPLLVQMRSAVPMTGILINVALAVTMVLATERMARLASVPLIGKTVRRLQRIPAYYDEHPPRNVFYYLLYPLLFPYWLFVGKARRELGLYRSIGTMTVIVLIGTGAYEYLRHWYPRLRLGSFIGADVMLFVFQSVLTMVLVMPVVTTVVLYRGRTKTLIGGALLAALFTYSTIRFGRPTTPVMTVTRLRARTKQDHDAARAAQIAALQAAWDDAPAAIREGPVGSKAIVDARAALGSVYQDDEAQVFRLFVSDEGVLILYVPDRWGRPVWLGMTRDRTVVEDRARLDARAADALSADP